MGVYRGGGAAGAAANAQQLLQNYSEKMVSTSSASGALSINVHSGNVHKFTLTGNVTSITISNEADQNLVPLTLIFVQDGTGSRTITWPASFKWPGGSAPILTTDANAIDIFTAFTDDGGTTWYAFTAGRNMA